MAGSVRNFNINYNKNSSFLKLLGCDYDELRKHLEKQFTDKMSWENYSVYWSIDHIKPVSSFNLLNEEEKKKCYHYSNLQPFPNKINSAKGGKIDYL